MRIARYLPPLVAIMILLAPVQASSDWIEFETKVKILMRLCKFPSVSICLVKNDTIVYSKTFGYSNFYLRKKAERGTIYMIGSITKSIVATALMQLYEKGKFDLDDNINDYLPFKVVDPFFPERNITFRMILAHQAGFNDFGLRLRYVLPIRLEARKGDYGYVLREMLTPQGKWYSKGYWFRRYAPGEVAFYSELGAILAGYLVEILSNMSLEEYCRKYIFEPLEMYNTSFSMDKLDKRRMAQPYTYVGRLYLPMPKYEFYLLDPAGGIYSTAEDLSHFLIAHMNGGVYKGKRILNEETVRLMHEIQYPDSPDILFTPLFAGTVQVYHGLGWMRVKIFDVELEGHTGADPGFNCHMYYIRGKKMGFVALANSPFFIPALGSPVRTAIFYYLFILSIIKELEDAQY